MERRRHSRQQWVEWLKEQSVSGLSISRFCQTKDVSANSFYVWRRRLGAQPATDPSLNRFVPLNVVGTEQVQIELPCGAKLQIPADESLTRLVLRILLELGAGQ